MGKKKVFLEAIATLVGTIIGAGVLGIPYVVAKAGFLTGLLNMLVLGAAVVFIYLYVGEVVLRTKEQHQLTGYAEKYLGRNGRRLMTFSMVFGIYGALTAYIIGEGEALAALFNFPNTFLFSLLFFVAASLIVYLGLSAIRESELLMSNIVIVIIILICLFSFLNVDLKNLATFNLSQIFYPYGVILFALAGAVAIPEMKEELVKNKRLLKKAIIIGALIPIVLYLLFTLVVVGITATETTEIATIGLGMLLGERMILFGNLFAIFAMATSFLTLGLALKEMYNYDYKINKKLAFILACLPPLLAFLFFAKSFVRVIGTTGGIAMGLEGILIVLMFRRAKKLGNRKPEYAITSNRFISYGLILIFTLGMVYTIWSLF